MKLKTIFYIKQSSPTYPFRNQNCSKFPPRVTEEHHTAKLMNIKKTVLTPSGLSLYYLTSFCFSRFCAPSLYPSCQQQVGPVIPGAAVELALRTHHGGPCFSMPARHMMHLNVAGGATRRFERGLRGRGTVLTKRHMRLQTK